MSIKSMKIYCGIVKGYKRGNKRSHVAINTLVSKRLYALTPDP